MTEAWRNGWNTHKSGYGLGKNPYDRWTQTHSYNQWIHGWKSRDREEKLGKRIFRYDEDQQ